MSQSWVRTELACQLEAVQTARLKLSDIGRSIAHAAIPSLLIAAPSPLICLIPPILPLPYQPRFLLIRSLWQASSTQILIVTISVH